LYIYRLYLFGAWCFSHAMSFMLATIFTQQYTRLSRSLDKITADRDKRGLSDSDVETLRQRHQEISTSVSDTDDFLMFHNAGAFCCQLVGDVFLLYDLIFFRITNDPLIISMRLFWMSGLFFGLCVTTAGGIMVNHYVSTQPVCCLFVCR